MQFYNKLILAVTIYRKKGILIIYFDDASFPVTDCIL